mgnify:CR=1 FL=1
MSFYSISFKTYVVASIFMAFSSTTYSSSETSARISAQNLCEMYGENSSICESAKRDIERAIASDERAIATSRKLQQLNRDLERDLQRMQGNRDRFQFPSYSPPSNYNSNSEYQKPSQNTITFLNQSGEPALVKVRGATSTQTFVPNGSSSIVNASGGTHYIIVRYGNSPPYTYSKGDSFSVNETTTQYSAITITLHKVAHGNYSSSSTSQTEFDSQ